MLIASVQYNKDMLFSETLLKLKSCFMLQFPIIQIKIETVALENREHIKRLLSDALGRVCSTIFAQPGYLHI